MDHQLAHAKIGVISFGLAVGVTWAISVAFLAVMTAAFKWGAVFAMMLQNIYVGYGPNFIGAVTGSVWGFVHGFLFGMLIAFFYNRFLSSRYIHHSPKTDSGE